MMTVGCAGFSVPATRYFKELAFLEVQETHLATPGTGTLRRWKREAGPNFGFALLAPKAFAEEGFRPSPATDAARASLKTVAAELNAQTVVFTCPAEFAFTKANRAAVQACLASMATEFATVVFEPPPSWAIEPSTALGDAAGALVARDPLQHGAAPGRVAYYRLHGPAGHKSRYEEAALERLARLVRDAEHERATCVFTNVDMFTDAKRFLAALAALGV
jgi:uncharacterized protein YecE (DUF72 family)